MEGEATGVEPTGSPPSSTPTNHCSCSSGSSSRGINKGEGAPRRHEFEKPLRAAAAATDSRGGPTRPDTTIAFVAAALVGLSAELQQQLLLLQQEQQHPFCSTALAAAGGAAAAAAAAARLRNRTGEPLLLRREVFFLLLLSLLLLLLPPPWGLLQCLCGSEAPSAAKGAPVQHAAAAAAFPLEPAAGALPLDCSCSNEWRCFLAEHTLQDSRKACCCCCCCCCRMQFPPSGRRGPMVSSSDSTCSNTSSDRSNSRGSRTGSNSGPAAAAAAAGNPSSSSSSSNSTEASGKACLAYKMLTFGASLEEASSAKETILSVKVAHLIFTEEALPLIDNKKKLSIAVIYKGEDLAQACGDQRRVTLNLGHVFQLPFSSTFPMHTPSIEIYVMLVRKTQPFCTVASAATAAATAASVVVADCSRVNLSSLCVVMWRYPFLSLEPYAACLLPRRRDGVRPLPVSLLQQESLSNLRKCVAGAKVSLGRRCRGLGQLVSMRDYSLFIGTNSAEEAGTICMSVKLDTTSSKAKGFLFYWHYDLRQGASSSKVDRAAEVRVESTPYEDLKANLNSLKETRKNLVQLRLAAFSSPISGDTVFDLKGLTSRIDRLLVQMERDGVVVVPMITRLKAGDCSANRFTSFFLDSHPYRILATTPIPLFSAETVVKAMNGSIRDRTSEHGSDDELAQVRLGDVSGGVLRFDLRLPRGAGSLPFASAAEQQQEEFAAAAASPAPERSASETPEEGPELAPVRPLYLEETRSMLDKWREGYYFRRLPSGHPLRIFSLFKNDQLFVSRHMVGRPRSGLLLAILVLGDDDVDMEEASKSSRMRFSAAVDYKGFRVVVLPLPESVPEVLAWPQPLSARIRHEISFLETKLNICNLLQPVSPHDPPSGRTILLSLKSRGADTMMLYRTCYTLPLFSGIEDGKASPGLAQRLRTIPFEFSADVEMAVKNNKNVQSRAAVKPSGVGDAYKDPIVRSPFSRLYSPVYFLTNNYQRMHRDNVEPIVCGRVPPGRKTRRLGTIVKSVMVDEYVVLSLHSSTEQGCMLGGLNWYNCYCLVRLVCWWDCRVVAELERMEPYGPYDSISLTAHLHRRGINMRLLGDFSPARTTIDLYYLNQKRDLYK
ncbi:hypothetical protein ACSSS7_007248 [Eimeria intestinalis]